MAAASTIDLDTSKRFMTNALESAKRLGIPVFGEDFDFGLKTAYADAIKARPDLEHARTDNAMERALTQFRSDNSQVVASAGSISPAVKPEIDGPVRS